MLAVNLVLLFATGSLSSPARVLKQRVQKFRNFPVIGIQEKHNKKEAREEFDLNEELIEHPRDARQVDSYSTDLTDPQDDPFVEQAVYLTPEDIEARSLSANDLKRALPEHENQKEFLFTETEEALDINGPLRLERDGAHGHLHKGSDIHRGGRTQQRDPAPFPISGEYDDEVYDYDYQEPSFQSQQHRQGKQTGAVGVALGVLSSPPSSDGNYNFK